MTYYSFNENFGGSEVEYAVGKINRAACDEIDKAVSSAIPVMREQL